MAVYRITTEVPAHTRKSGKAAVPAVRRVRLRVGLSAGLAMKLTVLLVAVFAVAVTLLRVISPSSSSDLQAIITPPANCAMPCWNGIQPGVTTVDQALAILQADSTVLDYQETPGKLSWWWNGDQLAAFDTSGRAFHGRMEYAVVNGADRITSIVLDTTVLLGDVQLALGSPNAMTVHTVQPQNASQRAGAVYVAHYETLSVFTMLDCPMNVDDFWQSPVYITFGTPVLTFEGETFQVDALPDWFFRDHAPGCAMN